MTTSTTEPGEGASRSRFVAQWGAQPPACGWVPNGWPARLGTYTVAAEAHGRATLNPSKGPRHHPQ